MCIRDSIRRNAHIEFSVFFQRKNVDVILFSDIDLTLSLIHIYADLCNYYLYVDDTVERPCKNVCAGSVPDKSTI